MTRGSSLSVTSVPSVSGSAVKECRVPKARTWVALETTPRSSSTDLGLAKLEAA